MKRTLLFSVMLLSTACAVNHWEPTGGRYVMESRGFEVNLPSGWKRYNQTQEALLLTRDGVLLQQITITRQAIGKGLAHIKKKFSKEMLPQEAAGLITDSIRSNPDYGNVEIIDNSPALVSGYPGFKITYRYRTQGGLARKVVYYGLLHGDWYYELVCSAASRYYFDRDSAIFEGIEQSFKIL